MLPYFIIGSSAATFVLFLTTIFLILLGTSGTTASFKTYFTEILQLNIYMGFLVSLEIRLETRMDEFTHNSLRHTAAL